MCEYNYSVYNIKFIFVPFLVTHYSSQNLIDIVTIFKMSITIYLQGYRAI